MAFERIWNRVQQSLHPGESPRKEPELSEIRHDILDEIRGKVQELSAGHTLFPFHHINIEIRARNPAEHAAIQATWIDRGELRSDVLSMLTRAECEYSRDLVVETRLDEASVENGSEKMFCVTCSTGKPTAVPSATEEPLRLTVQSGSAKPATLELAADNTNLGRLLEVFDENGQYIRRNDLAFDEADNGVNETVGRTHAQITRQKDGGFALVNTRRNDKNPTAILRHGRSIPVILVPQTLQRGDVIQLGRARIAVS